MSLNVKNDHAHRLARELADMTGETLTEAVTTALRERLARERAARGGDLTERLLAIGRDCASRLREPFATGDHGELLHDEAGLPR
jgi:antitoxin VapB